MGSETSISGGASDSSGTQSLDRAMALLMDVGRAGGDGCRLSDLVARSGLSKPTARRLLAALVRSGLLDQDGDSRRYFVGPEAHILGVVASSRFGIRAMALDGLSRLADVTGDTAFISVRREADAVCLHREEGPYPIRTHVLQTGDRHPLGVGAGGLAILAALPDEELERVLDANHLVLAQYYEGYSPRVLQAVVQQARQDGYALNPGLIVPGSWGIGVAVRGPDGRVAGALSIAAVEHRLDDKRRRELAPLLQDEVRQLEDLLRRPEIGAAKPAFPAAPRSRVPRSVGPANATLLRAASRW